MSLRASDLKRRTTLTTLNTSSLRLRRLQKWCLRWRLCKHAPLVAISTLITNMSFASIRASNKQMWTSSHTPEQLIHCAQWCACGRAERIKENEEENDLSNTMQARIWLAFIDTIWFDLIHTWHKWLIKWHTHSQLNLYSFLKRHHAVQSLNNYQKSL